MPILMLLLLLVLGGCASEPKETTLEQRTLRFDLQVLVIEVGRLAEVEGFVEGELKNELFSRQEFIKDHELLVLKAFSFGCAAPRSKMVSELEDILAQVDAHTLSDEKAAELARQIVQDNIEGWMRQVLHPQVSPRIIWGQLRPALGRVDRQLTLIQVPTGDSNASR
jgi:hypothetical protein